MLKCDFRACKKFLRHRASLGRFVFEPPAKDHGGDFRCGKWRLKRRRTLFLCSRHGCIPAGKLRRRKSEGFQKNLRRNN
ncbi:MAG: hypothetical protein IKN82_05835 [Treponema sp.]|nr:hypothetical protein [Treponema sp.]